MWKKKGDKQAKLMSRWGHGIFVGVRKRSREIWVATKKGDVISVRTVKRILEAERWSEDCWKWLKRTLWNKYKEDPDEDGEVREGKEVDVRSEEDKEKEEKTKGKGGGGVTVKMREVRPRYFQIKKKDAEEHGYTRGCAGCTSWVKGMARQPHNERCRERFREVVRKEAKFERAKEQKEEFERKVDAKRRKK